LAITDAYATAAEYRTRYSITQTSGQLAEAAILADLTAISRHIDSKVGRFFTKDASAVARKYRRDERNPNAEILHVDDLVSVTSIKIDEDNDGSFADESALAVADFELQPVNAALGAEVKPFTMIRATPWGAQGSWPTGIWIEVTAVFGWPAVPAAIKSATLDIAAILRIESPRATRRIPEMGDAIESSREAQDILQAIVATYRHPRSVFV
jgi:hypothetical protein